MERNEFISKLFARAKECGITECEAYFSSGDSFDATVFSGEVIDYNVASSSGLGFRCLVDGKMGYSSTQALDEEAIELLVTSAKSNAEVIDSDDIQFLFEGAKYESINQYNPEIDKISALAKITMAKDMEKKTLAKDNRIVQTEGSTVFSQTITKQIVNTKGLSTEHTANVMGGYIVPVAKDGENVANGVGMACSNDPKDLNFDAAIDKSVKEALDQLSGKPVESGKYKIIMRNDAMTSLLATFSGIFSADSAQKGLSRLNNKEGQKVASDKLTLTDDPHMENSATSTPFDGEGVPTYRKNVIENGILTTLLHNLKTANKQGVKTTANASRPSYSAAIGVMPTNFYVQPGEVSYEKLIENMGDGIIITSLQGLHAGANPISGDFSLGTKGYRVEGGKITGSVKQITIAGNFYTLMENVVEAANDIDFSMPGSSRFGSPSLFVGEMSVAGK